MIRIQYLLPLIAASLLSMPATAADPQSDVAPVRTVQFADLDLESSEGRAVLERRIDRAAKSLCAVDGAPVSSALSDEQARCEAATASEAKGYVTAAVRANRARATSFASR